MTINKIVVDNKIKPNEARVHVYTDHEHTVVFVKLAPDWEVVKVWGAGLYDFFQTANGRQLALNACLPMEEIRMVTKSRVEYTIRKDDPILDDLRVYMEAQNVL
jgi:hypothetical protein